MSEWKVVLVTRRGAQTVEMLLTKDSTFKDAVDEALEFDDPPPWEDFVSITAYRLKNPKETEWKTN